MNNKKFSKRQDGDILEVSVRDESHRPLFKGEARVRDKQSMKELFKDLKNKGININQETDWF